MMTGHSNTDPQLQLDHQLCFALYSASLAMSKAYKPQLETLGLTYPQYLVMLVLWQQDGITVSEIGERLFLDSGTLTPLLKRLETLGLITRMRDAGDERRVRIRLSNQGQGLKARARAVPGCMLEAAQCSAQEAGDMTRQLKALRERLRTATT